MLPVFDYQDYAARVMANRENFGLHDEMGVGKTATTIRALDYAGAMRGIIVAPASVRSVWVGEFEKFAAYPRNIIKGQSIHDFIAWQRGRFDVLITSYELATKWAAEAYKSVSICDFVVTDEAHYLKNETTNRCEAILGKQADRNECLTSWTKQYFHITGTPMANDPMDIYTFLKAVRAIPNMSSKEFLGYFFFARSTTYGTRTSVKPEMVETLKKLIANNSIRRTKSEVGLLLPPIFLTEVNVDGDTHEIRAMLSQHPGLEKAIMDAVEQGGLSFLDAQHIATLRRLVGEAKAVPYGHMLVDELAGNLEKRVVFGIHKDCLYSLRTFLAKRKIHAVIVTGETPERERQHAVYSFQNDPEVRVFIGNVRAAGTGITLTAACEIDMLESDWTPAGNAQALMRVHRVGQSRKVRARFITLAKSIDVVVNRVVAAKTAAIAAVDNSPMTAAPSVDGANAAR